MLQSPKIQEFSAAVRPAPQKNIILEKDHFSVLARNNGVILTHGTLYVFFARYQNCQCFDGRYGCSGRAAVGATLVFSALSNGGLSFTSLLFMNSPKKLLAGQLAKAVVPHLGGTAHASRPPKAVAKTLRQLAKQLTKQQGKQAKAAAAVLQPTPLTAKRARKVVAGELATALQPYFETAEGSAEKAPKSITKTVKRLAAQVVKQRRKQAKQSAKQAKQGAKQTAKEAKQATKAAPVAAPAVKAAAPLTARRAAAAPKRTPAKKATTASVTTEASTVE